MTSWSSQGLVSVYFLVCISVEDLYVQRHLVISIKTLVSTTFSISRSQYVGGHFCIHVGNWKRERGKSIFPGDHRVSKWQI